MNLKSIKDEVLSRLPSEEIAYGEILFNNCDCQILSQSAVSIDFLISPALLDGTAMLNNTTDENESKKQSTKNTHARV